MSDDDEDDTFNQRPLGFHHLIGLPDSDEGIPVLPTSELPTEISRRYDTELPTTHPYLGRLDNVTSDVLLQHNDMVTLLATQTNTLVFPDFTLPLLLRDTSDIRLMKQCASEKLNTFALLAPNESFNGVFPYGVIMEIYEASISDNVMSLKARARHRCRVMALSSDSHALYAQFCTATVRMIGEMASTSPLASTQLMALLRCRSLGSVHEQDLRRCRRQRRWHAAQFTFPYWLYDRYEMALYVDRLRAGLERQYPKDCIPEDPIKLSYWFVQNYFLKHTERLDILAMDTALARLRYENELLAKERTICCLNCDTEIAQHRNVFAMSKDGVQSNYCNPNGHIYETITVTEAMNYDLISIPSHEFSWFPGYAWSIIQCKRCNAHLGWRFISKHLEPKCFFGLAKSNLGVGIIEPMTDDL